MAGPFSILDTIDKIHPVLIEHSVSRADLASHVWHLCLIHWWSPLCCWRFALSSISVNLSTFIIYWSHDASGKWACSQWMLIWFWCSCLHSMLTALWCLYMFKKVAFVRSSIAMDRSNQLIASWKSYQLVSWMSKIEPKNQYNPSNGTSIRRISIGHKKSPWYWWNRKYHGALRVHCVCLISSQSNSKISIVSNLSPCSINFRYSIISVPGKHRVEDFIN